MVEFSTIIQQATSGNIMSIMGNNNRVISLKS